VTTPFRKDPSVIKLSGNPMPGKAISITGADREWEWVVQKPLGSSGAITVYRGAKLAEGIEVVIEAVTDAEYEANETARKTIAPKKGAKPPTFAIDNVIINFNEITRVSLKKISQPQITATLSWLFTWTFIEYNPPAPVTVGPADPDYKNAKPGQDKDIVALQAKAAALQAQLAKA